MVAQSADRAGSDLNLDVPATTNQGFVDIVERRFDAGVRLGERVAKDAIALSLGPQLRTVAGSAPADFGGSSALRAISISIACRAKAARKSLDINAVADSHCAEKKKRAGR